MSGPKTRYPQRSYLRNLGYATATFETNSTSAPDGIVGDIVSSVTRTDVGDFTVTLVDAFVHVSAIAEVEEDQAVTAKAIPASTSTITVHVVDDALAPVETTDYTVRLHIWVGDSTIS